MAETAKQIPLNEALRYKKDGQEEGVYRATFPQAIGYGTTAVGGAIISVAVRAAIEFVASPQHQDVVQYAVNFVRPAFGAPKETVFHFRITNTTKSMILVHVDVKQSGRLCLVGYLTLSNLSSNHGLDQQPQNKWTLSPPPPPQPSFDALEKDEDEKNWICYHLPYRPEAWDQGASYVVYTIPYERKFASIYDMWLTPGWKDPTSPAVWTNDNIDYAIDSALSPTYALVDPQFPGWIYKTQLAYGVSQRDARRQGRSDAFTRDEFTPASLKTIPATISIMTEFKRRLPDKGLKWLFLRVTTKLLHNGRCDYSIDVLDPEGNLLAVAQHFVQVIDLSAKFERKPKI